MDVYGALKQIPNASMWPISELVPALIGIAITHNRPLMTVISEYERDHRALVPRLSEQEISVLARTKPFSLIDLDDAFGRGRDRREAQWGHGERPAG